MSENLKQAGGEESEAKGVAQLPAGLEQALRERARSASELPWLAQRVQLEVDFRSQARLWLARRGGGLQRQAAGKVGLARLPRSLWQPLGAALGGAILGYCLLPALPDSALPQWLLALGGLGVASAALGALAALGIAQWRSVRAALTA